MNIFKALSVAAVASTLLFTATACGSEATPESDSSSTVQSAEATVDSKAEIVSVVDRYYEIVSDKEQLQPLIDVSETIPEGASDEEAETAVAAAAPEIFALFDLEDEHSIRNAYTFIHASSMFASMGEKLEFSVPEEAVTVDGDTAKYDGTKTVAFVDGEQQPSPEAEPVEENYINLVKKDGAWLIVAPAM